ncbi:hypothetical protein SAMN05216266_114116 [Amycolatopsis marina]|uniref:Uncharacterized protein n=1 Tax=Amycolatopsis marina TaxID=490629 RepID=A0A1I1BHP1_9PSEU|nr:hypothetical protein [Amycolatopsis marina]SFB49889.1 hypothetical protein SAMN05216266_114116 [Amycolatopsis marina]
MLFVPVLQEVAARMAGAPPQVRVDPVQQAYRLRDAVELVRPDWVVTHHDPLAEVEAVRAAGTHIDLVDVELAAQPPLRDLVELTRVLTALYPQRPVAASITGPAGLSAAMAAGDDAVPLDLLDCGDVLAELVSAYVSSGARKLLVWEPEVPPELVSEVRSAHSPIVRRLELLGVPAVLCGAATISSDGYWAHATGEGGHRAMLVPADRFSRGATDCFAELWRSWNASAAEHVADPITLLITDEPVPAECDMNLLRAAGTREFHG